MYIDKELIEDQLFQILDQYNNRKITTKYIDKLKLYIKQCYCIT